MPRVSVIIPTHNRARFLAESIQSVLAQTFDNLETIVVDDGSTDNTREVVGNFLGPRVKYVYQENQGASAARNAGILIATGDFIALLDSDDVWLGDKLALQVDLLDSHPKAGLVYSDAYLFDDQSGAILGRFLEGKGVFSGKVLRQLLSTQFIKTSTVVIRRNVFDVTGYFDESMMRVHDRDMWLRIAYHFDIQGISIPLARIRVHSSGISQNWEGVWTGRAMVMNKAQRDFTLSRDERRILKTNLSRVYYQHGRYLVLNGKLIEGRAKLLDCLRLRPISIRAYLYVIVSLLGRRFIVKAAFYVKKLKAIAAT